jgi:hypothetical protein
MMALQVRIDFGSRLSSDRDKMSDAALPSDRRRLSPCSRPDEVIAKVVTALKDTFKVEKVALGHCTGDPTVAALRQAFGALLSRWDRAPLPVPLWPFSPLGHDLANTAIAASRVSALAVSW